MSETMVSHKISGSALKYSCMSRLRSEDVRYPLGVAATHSGIASASIVR